MEYEMPRKRIKCADGFSMSVQASAGHYCEPRQTGLGFYSKYEVGFPSQADCDLEEGLPDEEIGAEFFHDWDRWSDD